MRTEDVSGIEKSGLRNMLDKRSDEVRKGLAKKLTFRRKKKETISRPNTDARSVSDNQYDLQTPDHSYESHRLSTASHIPPMGTPSIQQLPLRRHEHTSWEPSSPGSPLTSRLPQVPSPAAIPQIKRWMGTGRPVERWIPPFKDLELWDPNGDVLVYLGYKGQSHPPPTFRLSSQVIEATESRYLVTALRESLIQDDASRPISPRAKDTAASNLDDGQDQPFGSGNQYPSAADHEGVKFELFIPTHPSLSKLDQLRHQITTRNFFGLLYNASLVGFSLHQALTDLQQRLNSYMPPESQNVHLIIHHIVMRGIDDVRSDVETAVSLLAWSESPDVRWEQGWRDSFVHCVGMYVDVERCADFNNLTTVTKTLLERAFLETQFKLQAAEDRLAEFSFEDMWPMEDPACIPPKQAAKRLQTMLIDHYALNHQYWPPFAYPQDSSPPISPTQSEFEEEPGLWLTRSLTMALQKDFGALYDYLVNRDIVWDVSEARAGRKWMIASESGEPFEADTPEVPLTDILVEFDNKFRFPHIPHPYPLLPKSMHKEGSKDGGRGKHPDSEPRELSRPRAESFERKIQIAYSDSTNISALGSDFSQSQLVEAFARFEKTDMIGEADPTAARLGRWVLIYGILQILASVSVDTPGVRYRDDVPYHLGVSSSGSRMPPWRRSSNSSGEGEAMHELSYCWTTPQKWTVAESISEAGSLEDDATK